MKMPSARAIGNGRGESPETIQYSLVRGVSWYRAEAVPVEKQRSQFQPSKVCVPIQRGDNDQPLAFNR